MRAEVKWPPMNTDKHRSPQRNKRRSPPKHSGLLPFAFCLLPFSVLQPAPAATYDLVVYGGTPGGIATAVSAARLGRSVALLEYHRHIGGMSASGLGKSDI